ncbi:MAG: MFS transporter [Pseudorhodoplanes sp.]|nr:MFS transporter [Pseudorhodoplanes sp.]GIK79262.1 MAG: MFS transporter [Alphaproteobacteria bacterium]
MIDTSRRDATGRAAFSPQTSGTVAAAGGFAARLGLFFAALFVLVGIVTPFFPVWLAAKGLDSGQIGLVLAAPLLVRIAAVPLAARLADRRGALREALIAVCFATAVAYVAVALADGFVAILAAVVLMAIVNAPAIALTDAYALRGLKDSGRAYGPVRLWGSLAFIVANIGAGLTLDILPARHLIVLILAAAAMVALAALILSPIRPTAAAPAHGERARDLLRQPVFLAVIVAAGLVQSSHAVYHGFSTIAWSAAGFDGLTIGLLWALGVAAEIVLFALSGWLPPACGPLVLLLIGAAGAVLRWTAMAFDPPGWALPALQILHALSFGATHLGTVGFLAQAASERLGATAQGLFYLALSPLMAVTMGASGFLYAAYGAGAYAAMALAAAVALVLTAFALRANPAQRQA